MRRAVRLLRGHRVAFAPIEGARPGAQCGHYVMGGSAWCARKSQIRSCSHLFADSRLNGRGRSRGRNEKPRSKARISKANGGGSGIRTRARGLPPRTV